ncbi:hypothetical protein B0H14DRAFT_2865564 [Mycena olivaceomarginata]|nr:hypothetical protein B0H14DRAFT_2865564 [Mycena olivaceomarginata]
MTDERPAIRISPNDNEALEQIIEQYKDGVVTVTMSSLLSLGALYPSVLCKTCLPTIASCSPTSVGSMPMTKNKQELAEVEGLPAAMRIITAKSTLSMQPGLHPIEFRSGVPTPIPTSEAASGPRSAKTTAKVGAVAITTASTNTSSPAKRCTEGLGR